MKALQLNRARIINSLANDLRRFAGVAAGEVLITDRRHFDLDVDAVEKRAGDAGAIALDLQRRADTFLLRVGEKAAGEERKGVKSFVVSQPRSRCRTCDSCVLKTDLFNGVRQV